jgi:hypothetical protein
MGGSRKKPTKELRAYLSQLGKKGGKKGGLERAKRLTEERRKEIALKAARTRWAGHTPNKRTKK